MGELRGSFRALNGSCSPDVHSLSSLSILGLNTVTKRLTRSESHARTSSLCSSMRIPEKDCLEEIQCFFPSLSQTTSGTPRAWFIELLSSFNLSKIRSPMGPLEKVKYTPTRERVCARYALIQAFDPDGISKYRFVDLAGLG